MKKKTLEEQASKAEETVGQESKETKKVDSKAITDFVCQKQIEAIEEAHSSGLIFNIESLACFIVASEKLVEAAKTAFALSGLKQILSKILE